MMLATDLDRTLIANGHDPDDGSLPKLLELIKENGITLTYVSGRSIDLLYRAIEKYKLAIPEYFIGAVGTEMYKKEGESLKEFVPWVEEIRRKNPSWSSKDIIKNVGQVPPLVLQEESLQNNYKTSYYLDESGVETDTRKDILNHLQKVLADMGLEAEIVYSFDPLKKKGLVDIVPTSATKLTALGFLRKQLRLEKGEIVYAGDSGNDVTVLSACYKGIIVKNASDEVKEAVVSKRKSNTCLDSLYIAKGYQGLNGNYSSGILEGLKHFGAI